MIDGRLRITPPDLAKRFREKIDGCRKAFMELHGPIPSDQFEAKLLECFGGKIVEDTAESSTPPPTDEWTTERLGFRCRTAGQKG